MERTIKYGGHCADLPPAEVPIGWQRKIHQNSVVYISPSGSVLTCLEQAKSYLLTDGTCKCGLECPLILHKVFNFDPGAVVKQRTAEDAKADSDFTKLCIHKRKIIAVATLHRSMETHLPSCSTGTGNLSLLNHQAIRNDVHNGPSNSVAPDNKNAYKLQHYHHEQGSPPHRDAYTGQPRPRLGGSDNSVQMSPYRSHHSGLLSPPSSTSCSSQRYADGTPSPRPDPLRSPEPPAFMFHGALHQGSGHINGEQFTPLSPPGIMFHSSPPSTKLSCALTGRTNVSLSPSLNSKSPNRQKSPCNFPRNADYQHKSPPTCFTQQHPPIAQLPPCVVQKKQVTSEKDPLGILDPIPSKSQARDQREQAISTPTRLQFSSPPQVQPVNVNIPPAIVPLPSNLPLPMVKTGAVGHTMRGQLPNPPSVSSSPITSPVHFPGPARAEDTAHHSQNSILVSSQHGSCTLAIGLQGTKLPPRSPRASIGPPRTSIPLHHIKEMASPLLAGVSSGGNRYHDSICPPVPGVDSGHGNHSMGVASQQLIDQQSPSSFPASSLLSAAAKAQLVNQSKLTHGAMGTQAHCGGLRNPGLIGGARQMYSDSYGVSDPKYHQNAGLTSSDGQSGRAALRDKLMAQQREVLRKRKMPSEGAGDPSFTVNIQHVSGSTGYSEDMKRLLQQGGQPTATSMAQLLQSMSQQSMQNGLAHPVQQPGRSGKSPFFEDSMPQMSTLQGMQGSHQPLTRAKLPVPGFQNFSNECHQNAGDATAMNMDQFACQMNQMHDPAFGVNLGNLGYSGHEDVRSICNAASHRQQFGHHTKQLQGNLSFRDGTGLSSVMSNGGFDSFSESDEAHFLNSELKHAQEACKQQQIAQRDKSLRVMNIPQSQDGLPRHGSIHETPSFNPMDSLLKNFQVGFLERLLHPHRTVISRPRSTSQFDTTCFQDSRRELPSALSPSEHGGMNGANQHPKSGLSRKATSSVITCNGTDAFAASIAPVPMKVSQSVIHSPLHFYPEELVQHRLRTDRPCKKPKELDSVSAGVASTALRLNSLHNDVQRQWFRNVEGQEHGLSYREKLQEDGQGLNGIGCNVETFRRHACLPQFSQMDSRKGSFTHMNGGDPRIIQSARDIAASKGDVASLSGDFRLHNGHSNGRLNGNYIGLYKGDLNGCSASNVTDSEKSEENLRRHADASFPSQWLLHKPGSQPIRGLLWGQDLGFQLKEGQPYLSGQLEQDRFHKTLKDDLEALTRAKRIQQNSGELNNYLEAAIEDAMSKLNQLTANRDGQIKAPKPKRRKIAR